MLVVAHVSLSHDTITNISSQDLWTGWEYAVQPRAENVQDKPILGSVQRLMPL
jgi:hypothetical protein